MAISLNLLRTVIIFAALAVLTPVSAVFASPATGNGPRLALVIGNGAYAAAPVLINPVNDAKGVAAALRRLGFKVISGYDLNSVQLRDTLREFSAALPESKAALVYYAGHGVSMDEENFLLPVDISLKNAADLDINAINVSVILKQMRREDRVNIVILDACRNNPFAEALAQGIKNRALVSDRGLSRIDGNLAKGSLIAFATDPKSVALDGAAGQNSPFTRALLQHLEDPGVSIDTVMNRVRQQVWEETDNKQMPWVNTSIIGEFYLNPVANAAPASAQTAALTPAVGPAAAVGDHASQETRLWDSAEKSNHPDDYKAYLEAYPQGAYAQMARNRIARAVPGDGQGGQQKLVYTPIALTPEAKSEIGSRDTELALKLNATDRKALQKRLSAIGFYKGSINGDMGDKTHHAIGDWQKQHGATPTERLGPLQYAALTQESEPLYRQAIESRALGGGAATATAGRTRHIVVHHRAASRHSYRHRGGGGGGAAAAFFGAAVGGILGHVIRH